MTLHSIPPTTSTGRARAPRSADPVRCRTGVSRVRGPESEHYAVNTTDYHKDSAVARVRPPLHCITCGGIKLADIRMVGVALEGDCLTCGSWQTVVAP